MRGKGFDVFCNGFPDRITPAYAGKSAFFTPLLCQLSGSPPPMRGKDFGVQIVRGFCGITPAYAGKSQIFQFTLLQTEDHPRLCGEKANKTIKTANAEGSPPPMRGKALCVAVPVSTNRITPAYAGKRCGKC